MTFLNPLFLWASFAVLIPIIVHLFNFRRPKKILFSNIELVKEVKKSVVKRLRLKQLLLLAARILAILCLVFLFANPVIISSSGVTNAGKRSVAIVIDNSYSMKAGNEKGDYFIQAKRLANEILDSYRREDEFLVMTTDELKLNYDFSDGEDAGRNIKEAKVNQNKNGLKDIFQLSEEIFARAKNENRTLVYLSDFQESTALADSQRVQPKDSALNFHFVPLANREQKNVYITDHEILTRIIEPGKPVELKMTLVNDGRSAAKDLSLRIMIEEKVIAISNESLAAGETKEVEISFTPAQNGWQSGYIQIDDYPIEFDNERYFSFYVPEKENVLIVEGESSRYIQNLYGELFPQFSSEFISHKNFSTAQLENYKFIVLLGINEISTGMQEQLRFHLEEGKSLLYFPGNELDLPSINRFFEANKIGSFSEKVELEEGISANIVDLEHPVFKDIFKKNTNKGKFDAPDVYKYYPFNANNEIIQNPILRLSTKEPVILESRPDKGLVYLFTVFPEDSWTNLPVKAIFAPLMLRLSMLMNQSQHVEQVQNLGEFTIKKVKTKEKELIHLLDGKGLDLIPEQYVQSGYIQLKFDKLNLKEGNYALMQNEKLLEKISFNVPDVESQLRALAKDELEVYLSERALGRIKVFEPEPDRLAAEISYEQEGFPLWKYFLMGGILFLLLEFAIIKIKFDT